MNDRTEASPTGHRVWVRLCCLLGGLNPMVQCVTTQLHGSLPLGPDSLFTCGFFFFFLRNSFYKWSSAYYSAVHSAYTLFHNWPIQYTLFRIFNQF